MTAPEHVGMLLGMALFAIVIFASLMDRRKP
jgi:hypothetical protein